ncbi:MAG: bifunctional response regulator/alkaline phosphatase family protein [Bacteroidales bacterium]|nr:bifunctional response regulator/alkaline phosphatase family protein [Bacteroidales bacterium]
MSNGRLLWVDDEIELLRAHILFLEKKGYEVVKATNGADAIDLCRQQAFDLVLLDEHMPGLSGLETLTRIKERSVSPAMPIVMVTKSEEEDIMEQAIGSQIADYLIKPVNPNQILLTLKKNIHKQEIVSEVTQTGYRKAFTDLAMMIENARTAQDWINTYRQLVYWELQLQEAQSDMSEMLKMQKQEANGGFAKFIRQNYEKWIENRSKQPSSNSPLAGESLPPMMSPDVMKEKVFPLLDKKEKVFFVIFDNLRYDQWRTLSTEISGLFNIDEELYFSILPTVTQYARNAICSGLMPSDIKEMYPDLWVDEDEDEGKNLNEEQLIQTLMQRYRRRERFSYNKINDSQGAERLMQQFSNLMGNELNVVIINFIDILSHSRSEQQMVSELLPNEAAYRSITRSWFQHSRMKDLFEVISQSGYKVVVTTDHGSILVETPIKIIGDKNVNTNLRFKFGKNLAYKAKEVFEIKNPHRVKLPQPNLSTTYVFCYGDHFFAYPNNYNYYASHYRDTFQHGGVSMEEMIIPIITMEGK